MITGIDHIEIVVRDIDVAAEFFSKLGFEEVRRTEHHGSAVEMRVPGHEGIIIEFHTGLNIEPPGINHIAFRVDDAVSTVADLRAAGISDLPAEPKVASDSGRRIASFRDPFHNRWQLAE